MEPTAAQKRFSPYSRAAFILEWLAMWGPARSTYALNGIGGPYSTRYHYAACNRLDRAGLIARDWHNGISRNVRITDAGRALLAYWDERGR